MRPASHISDHEELKSLLDQSVTSYLDQRKRFDGKWMFYSNTEFPEECGFHHGKKGLRRAENLQKYLKKEGLGKEQIFLLTLAIFKSSSWLANIIACNLIRGNYEEDDTFGVVSNLNSTVFNPVSLFRHKRLFSEEVDSFGEDIVKIHKRETVEYLLDLEKRDNIHPFWSDTDKKINNLIKYLGSNEEKDVDMRYVTLTPRELIIMPDLEQAAIRAHDRGEQAANVYDGYDSDDEPITLPCSIM